MKGRVYQICLRSSILHGSKTWCLRERKVALLRRTKKTVMKAIHEMKLINEKNTNELMQILGVTVPITVRLDGNVL